MALAYCNCSMCRVWFYTILQGIGTCIDKALAHLIVTCLSMIYNSAHTITVLPRISPSYQVNLSVCCIYCFAHESSIIP
jgi:hypothetical protein